MLHTYLSKKSKNMIRRQIAVFAILLASSLASVAQKYHVTKVERQRIAIDNRYAADKEAEGMLAPYKMKVDSVMSPLVGRSAKYMKSHAPESELSNLLADIMVWAGTKYGETPDVGIYNMGGIRAALPEGDVTFGDVTDIAPFENKICFMTLTGAQLKILFQQMTQRGAGVSKGIEARYSADRKLVSLSLNGEAVADDRNYRLATIDYLIQGNDGFMELRNATELVSPKDNESNTRYLIAEFFREHMRRGEIVDAHIEGRVVIAEQ